MSDAPILRLVAPEPKRKRPRRAPRTDPPDELSAEQWAQLADWVRRKEPWAAAELEDLVERCLDHHRAHGNLLVNWVAACRLWVRNERAWRRRGGSRGTSGPASAGGLAGASEAVARRLGLFDDETTEEG